jgi:hypothetical protein
MGARYFLTFTWCWTGRGPAMHNGCYMSKLIERGGLIAGFAEGRRPRRRPRQAVKRSRTLRFDLTEDEFSEIEAAAADIGLAKGAFAAQATLTAARHRAGIRADSVLHEALGEFIRAAGLVRRIGVNLNQAVARLNATGQRSGDLLPYARESLHRAEVLDQAAEEVRRRIRR